MVWRLLELCRPLNLELPLPLVTEGDLTSSTVSTFCLVLDLVPEESSLFVRCLDLVLKLELPLVFVF